MADLYLAQREGVAGFRRLVAIKVIHPSMAHDEANVSMFLEEAKITARINHPNVVHVEDLGFVDDTYFLVMEYIHGGSLAQLLARLSSRRERLAPEVAVAIAARIAEGLHAAHETTDQEGRLIGLVHRDVSPQNILLSHQGHVKLIDFGVAKANDASAQTAVATLKGKVRYMSPEQALPTKLDRRADVYALGLVLWEMLTMRRALQGRNILEILESARRPEIEPPGSHAPGIPPGLDAVVMSALAPHPDDRPRDAKDFRRELVRTFPRAAAIDSVHLADLLVSALGTELDDMREAFPEEISRVLAAEQERMVGLLEGIDRTFPTLDGATGTMTLRFEPADFDLDELDHVFELSLGDVDDELLDADLDAALAPPVSFAPVEPDFDEETEVRVPTVVKILAQLRAQSTSLRDDTGTLGDGRRRRRGASESEPPDTIAARPSANAQRPVDEEPAQREEERREAARGEAAREPAAPQRSTPPSPRRVLRAVMGALAIAAFVVLVGTLTFLLIR